MKIPGHLAPIVVSQAPRVARLPAPNQGIRQQGCDVFEWAGCAAAIAGCAAFSGPALVACVAAAAPGCVKCVT